MIRLSENVLNTMATHTYNFGLKLTSITFCMIQSFHDEVKFHGLVAENDVISLEAFFNL